MKKLYIIRHAKSSWKDTMLDDFDRPLNKRGKLNAPFMGDILKNKNISPDIIISSPALRAKKTAEIIAEKTAYSKEIKFDRNIYEAETQELYKILSMVSDDEYIVFLFGHNPTLNMFAEEYVNFHDNIPTCGIVEIEFTCSKWADISAKNARLKSFEYPKKYD